MLHVILTDSAAEPVSFVRDDEGDCLVLSSAHVSVEAAADLRRLCERVTITGGPGDGYAAETAPIGDMASRVPGPQRATA